MKIVVFSDSHRKVDRMFHVMEEEKPDAVIHLGDVAEDVDQLRRIYKLPIYAVAGNNDFYPKDPEVRIIILNKIRIFLCHGHTLQVRLSRTRLLHCALKEQCTIAFYGHTHREESFKQNGVWIMNPGSISLSAYGKPSYIRMEIMDGQPQCKIIYPDY